MVTYVFMFMLFQSCIINIFYIIKIITWLCAISSTELLYVFAFIILAFTINPLLMYISQAWSNRTLNES